MPSRCACGLILMALTGCSLQPNSSAAPANDPRVNAEEVEGNPAKGQALYQKFCLTCHGSTGRGDGPTGRELPVDVPDFTNAEEMFNESDQALFTVIKYGGPAMNKSGLMHAWRGDLTDQDIRNVILYIRTLARPMA